MRLVLAVRRLVRYVIKFERNKPACVLLFVAVGASVAEKGVMAWYARLRGVPAILFPRGGGLIDACRSSRVHARWVKVAFGGARMMFCQSAAWQRFAIDTLGFAPTQAPVVQNWTATPELVRIGHARRPKDGPGGTRLLFLGWLDREKGVAELLEACRLLSAHRRFTLDVVGEGNFSAPARDFVARHGLESLVRFHGWLQADALLQIFADDEVLVLPSWAEGLPNAMIEAMAAGLAVVVTSVGGIPDVVTDRRNALVVPPRDVAALADALARVIDDPALGEHLGRAAAELAEREFGVERAADLIVQHIERLTRVAAATTAAPSVRVD